GAGPADYAVEASSGGPWQRLREVRNGNGGRDHLYLHESEARRLRIRALRAPGRHGMAIRSITVEPLAWGESLESFFQAIAKDAPRGSYPRGMSGEQSYWTVIGVDGGRDEALLNEDGMLETGKAQFSIEPFLATRGRLLTWADGESGQELDGGDIPIPSVTWSHGDLELEITAFAIDAEVASEGAGVPPGVPRLVPAGGAAVVARYRVTNRAARPARATLYLALRPFQVNPPTQFLNTRGGTAPIRTLAREGLVVRANGNRGIVSLTPPSGFGAAPFDAGDIVEFLRRGRLPRAARVSDPFEHASGALAYVLDIPARGTREVDASFPLEGMPGAAPARLDSAAGAALEQAGRACWGGGERPGG